MYDNASDIYNTLLGGYELQCTIFSDERKINNLSKHNFRDLFLDG